MNDEFRRLVFASCRIDRSQDVLMVRFNVPERPIIGVMPVIDGEVAERLKAAVLKTAER
jgi:hypothetical protein